jgi:hypothetical protein
MDGSSGRLRTTPSLRDLRHLATGGCIGTLGLTMALTALMPLATAPAAIAAPQVQVSGGTLSINSTADEPVSALMSSDAPIAGLGTPVADVFGPPPGATTASTWFAYGPRFLWHGTAPGPGAGCRSEPVGPGGQVHVACPDAVFQIDTTLGGGDDYLSVTSSSPMRVSGGEGDDGLRLDANGVAATLDGGPGKDSLRLEGRGVVHGGAGDDYISLHGPGAVADCGSGDDTVVDDLHYLSGPATVDEATCGPVLRPVPPHGLPTPPQPGEFRAVAAIKPRDGRVKLNAFRPSEAGRGTIQLKQARAVTDLGYPRPGTKWTSCSERRRFRMRAGRVLRTTLKLVPRVARRVPRLRPPRGRFSRKSMIPCSLHISGVDDDGERFHRTDFSLVLIKSK